MKLEGLVRKGFIYYVKQFIYYFKGIEEFKFRGGEFMIKFVIQKDYFLLQRGRSKGRVIRVRKVSWESIIIKLN